MRSTTEAAKSRLKLWHERSEEILKQTNIMDKNGVRWYGRHKIYTDFIAPFKWI